MKGGPFVVPGGIIRQRLCSADKRPGMSDVGLTDGPQLTGFDGRHSHRCARQCQKLHLAGYAVSVDKDHGADIARSQILLRQVLGENDALMLFNHSGAPCSMSNRV